MTVRDLIEQLQKLDQDKMIVINGYEGGCDFPNYTAKVKIALDQNTEWYYGRHEYIIPYKEEYVESECNAYVLENRR